MKKQNKNVKIPSLLKRLDALLALPDAKSDKKLKLPAGRMLINIVDHDLMVSVLVVSLFINITLFVAWLIVQTDPNLQLALLALK